jgi:hypothetical protein
MGQKAPTIDAPLTEDVKGEISPAPPDGFSSWLEYAVANFDVRSAQQNYLFKEGEAPSRDAIHAALHREVVELMASQASHSPVNDQVRAGSDGSEPTALSLSLTGQEMQALANFTHETHCDGDIQLNATPTGIGTALRVSCLKKCRPVMDITDYSVW